MTDGESDKLESLLDDEEITISSQDRDRKIADGRNIDIRDEQSENTQREDWLLPTHGARLRQTGGERPPAMENPVFRDAAEISASEWDPPSVARTADFYGRGSFHTSEGGGGAGRPAPEPQGVQREA